MRTSQYEKKRGFSGKKGEKKARKTSLAVKIGGKGRTASYLHRARSIAIEGSFLQKAR